MMLMSCATSYEGKGNRAYRASKKATGDVQRKLRKEAFIFYQKAIKTHPDKINISLRNQYLEMALLRANMILTEGSVDMDAVPLLIKDVDNMLTPDVNEVNRESYAAFLVLYADSNFARSKLYKALNTLDKAVEVAVNKAPIEEKKKSKLDNFARENYDAAEIEMINGKTNEDAECLVRAEFIAQVALLYDKNYKEAKELLSEIRKENVGTYSAYEAVVIDRPDTNIFDQVNKYDILLAVPVMQVTGSSVLMKVEMYNYSCNPQRLRPRNYYIVDTNGKQFKALSSSNIDREIVDQEHEVKMKLRFRKSGAKIEKLVYESDDKEHYTEKYFF
jgi:septum formation topological specificity factor MinE